MSTLRQEDPTPTPTATITPTPTATPVPIYDTLIPVGSIQMFGGPTPPDGWLWCDGSEIGREDYPQLFAVYGTYYGAGDGESTFKLPDCRGRVPVATGMGAGLSNRTLGQTFGAETHTLTVSEMPSHSHTYTVRGNATGLGTNFPALANNSGTLFTTAQTANAGSGQAHNNMQPSIALNFIIWSGVIELVLPGSDPGQLPTPAPGVIVYSEVEAQPVAFAYTVDAGQVMISVLLFAVLLVMLIQFVFKLRREV